jgi:hypothetical protein
MKITKALAGEHCPSGNDCDFVYDTDDTEDVLVRGRFLTATDAAELGIRLPAHEGILRLKRSVLREAR